MKTRSIFVFLFISFVLAANQLTIAQKPEKVWSIVKVDRSFEWYTAQATAWKKVIDADPKDASAWVNFYTANRMAHILDDEAWKSQTGPGYKALDEIVAGMGKAIPGTYEYYHVKIWNDGYQNDENVADLLKAYNMAPDRPEVYSSLVNYYEMKRDAEHEKEICKKWFDSNDISPNILNYNYNVLQSVDDKAILITNGDNDTYPLWILQYAMGIKPKVVVVNINLVTVDSYRKKLFEENGIPTDDFKALEQPSQEKIINHLIDRSGRPVYFANTLSTSYYDAHQKNLYLVGLAFKYSTENFDNVAVIQNSIENRFLLNYLKANFSNDISQSISDQMNLGYLPALIKLYEHYMLAGATQKAAEVKKTGATIAAKGDPAMNPDELFSAN